MHGEKTGVSQAFHHHPLVSFSGVLDDIIRVAHVSAPDLPGVASLQSVISERFTVTHIEDGAVDKKYQQQECFQTRPFVRVRRQTR